MTDLIVYGVALVIYLATVYAAYRYGLSRRVAPSAVYEELADLRYLKAELEDPPSPHTHKWPREPDMRKHGWLRYKCIVKGCNEIKWEAA